MGGEVNASGATMPVDAVRDLAIRALEGVGTARPGAEDTANVLLLGNLFGIHTHGVMRILNYAERIAAGGINKTPNIMTVRTAPGLGMVDGDNGLGPAVGMASLRLAIDIAKETGIAAVFARGSNHFGAIGPYGYMAATHGLASIIASNATTTMAPWGGSEGRLGNNPIGFIFPRPGGFPFILDMAMSVVARAKIRTALAEGTQIPDTWATDRNGRPTTDPAEALKGFLQPMGQHKGYGLSMVVDLLAGLMSNAAYLTHVVSWVDEPEKAQNIGHVFILIDPMRLMPEAVYSERIEDFVRIVTDTPPSDPEQPVMMPGDREAQLHAAQTENGIALPGDVLSGLKTLAGETA